VCHDQSGPLNLLDDVRDGERLPGSGRAPQRLKAKILVHSRRQLLDRLRLIAARLQSLRYLETRLVADP
jgi:hypothetical protein